MTGNTHAVIGATVASLLPLPSIGMVLIAVGAGVVASLLPDIDHRHSTISQRVRPLRWLVWWLPHRGLTHSVWAVALVALGAFALAPAWLAVAISAGYASHVVADMFTSRGVMLFYPFRSFVGFPVRIRTGGIVERLIAFAAAGLFVYLLAKKAGF